MAELSADQARFSFANWRAWFNRQMDAHLFRDERIDSTVIMTHMAATRLRSFEAAIVIGADAEHFAPPRAPAGSPTPVCAASWACRALNLSASSCRKTSPVCCLPVRPA
ncbi:MAG: hypothetical protein U5N85_06960 [Arcicella sp.]|nr:hypothetical protein [Arcicella sp.]